MGIATIIKENILPCRHVECPYYYCLAHQDFHRDSYAEEHPDLIEEFNEMTLKDVVVCQRYLDI